MAKIRITVGELDNLEVVKVATDATVEEAFEKAGFELSSEDKIQTLSGGEVDMDDDVEEGTTYLKVSKMKAGLF
jgi:hypothetical protein